MTYRTIEKLPQEECEELIKLLGVAFRSLSPQNKAEVMDIHAAAIRAKIREHCGLISKDQASEKNLDEGSRKVYGIVRRWGDQTGNVALLRDP